MSDSVVKLRIDSKEYDANIKRAGQALTDYFNKVKEGGGTLMHLDEGVMEAVKAMGSLGTQANNIKGGLRELTQATTDMTAAYRSLTDEEKASPLGQAMQQSIARMTERAGNMRDAMADVQASINNAASDTRVFDQIAGGAQMMTAGFQSAVGAMKLFGVETDNNVEVLAQLQAAMGVVNGLQTIQTALQKQSAVMQGVQAVQAAAAAAAQTSLAGATGAATIAQKAFNVVANANPYVLLATAVAAVGTALYAFASASSKAKQEAEEMAKAEEEAAKKSEDARNAFVNASAEAMNSASRLSSLQVAYKNANSEIEKTNILKQAQAEFKKLGIECNGVNDAQTLLIKNGSKVIELIQLQGNVAAVSAVRMEKFKESFKMLMENGYSASAAASLAGYNKDVQELDGQITNMQSRIQGLKGGLGIGAGGNTKTTKVEKQTDKFAADSILAQEKWIAQLENEWKRAGASIRDEYIPMIEMAKKKLAEMTGKAKGDGAPTFTMAQLEGMSFDNQIPTTRGNKGRAQDKLDLATAAFATGGTSDKDISNYISGIKNALSNANLGDELYNNMTEKLKDATTVSTLLQEMMERGLAGADLETTAQALKEKLLSPEGIDQTAIQSFLDELNKQIEEAGGVGLKLNADTGEVTDDKGKGKDDGEDLKKFNEGIGKLSGGLSQVTGGLKAIGVEVPKEVDQVIGVINGVSQIISGVSTIIGVFQTSAITANTIALGALTSAVTANTFAKFIPFFAGGGIVPHAANGYFVGGNSFSGDNTPIMANAGELVLSKSQQGVLASMLTDEERGGGNAQPYLDGEKIYLGLQAYMRRSGLGEIVTSER